MKAEDMNNKSERNPGKSVSRGVVAAKQMHVTYYKSNIMRCSYRGETKDFIRFWREAN